MSGKAMKVLSTTDHATDREGMKYVYTVLSRRAGGVSVGVNLNPNHACNFHCVYCQVPDLKRGMGVEIELERLRRELEDLLHEVLRGDWLEQNAPEGHRKLCSLAFSGDGEPTSSPSFAEAVDIVADTLQKEGLAGKLRFILITNGSLTDKPAVQAGLRRLAAAGGELWFKLDGGTDERIKKVNGSPLGVERALANLKIAAGLCPTRIQTCVFAWDDEPPSEEDQQAYLDLLTRAKSEGVEVLDVLLYGLARPSCQPEASHLSKLPAEWVEAYAERIRARGYEVEVSA